MNKRSLLHLSLLLFLLAPFYQIQAQQCLGDAPTYYSAVPDPNNPGKCFLQIDWGDSMPEILCGNPGTPAPGSTIPEGRRIEFLYATVNGTEYTLYNRLDCPSNITTLQYGPEPNTYLTAFSEADFCLAAGEHAIHVEGVQLNAADFDCFLLNSQIPAPIELVYFKGQSGEHANILEWATSSEENTASFVLERSPDGKRNFEFVGSVAAKGFSNQLERYRLEDRKPRPVTYYRLRSIDFDGSESTSDWIAIQRSKEVVDKLLEVAPIPLGNEPLSLYYQADFEEQIVVSISDINGRLLWEERKTLEPGIHNWTIDLPYFHQHLLVLRLHTREGITSRMIPREIGF